MFKNINTVKKTNKYLHLQSSHYAFQSVYPLVRVWEYCMFTVFVQEILDMHYSSFLFLFSLKDKDAEAQGFVDNASLGLSP